jgi:hypothetical protein
MAKSQISFTKVFIYIQKESCEKMTDSGEMLCNNLSYDIYISYLYDVGGRKMFISIFH